jgi:hypothetical protein
MSEFLIVLLYPVSIGFTLVCVGLLEPELGIDTLAMPTKNTVITTSEINPPQIIAIHSRVDLPLGVLSIILGIICLKIHNKNTVL